ncbi:hypothetical protein ES707_19531 [subsurface metagenome]
MAVGDIIRETGSLDFDTTGGTLPKIIHVAGNVYAIAYQGYYNDGYLRTVSISDDGVTLGLISFLEFDTDNGKQPWIIHIAGTVYAVAYVGSGDNGTLKTFNISDDGTSITFIQTFVFDAGATIIEPVIVHISGTTYAIFYGGPGNDGWVKTVTIQDNGVITGEIAFLEFDVAYGVYSDPIHISGDVWAIAYMGDALYGPGRIKTFTITGAGAIGAITSYDYDANQTSAPDIFHISGNVYGIAYGGPGFDGWLKTTVINNDGTLGRAVLSFLEFDPSNGKNPWVTPIGSNVWAIAYDGPDGDGWLRTIKIENDGTITGEVDFHEYDEATGLYASMLHVDGDIYAIAYFGPGNDGWLKTVEIETAAPTVAPTVTTDPATEVEATAATGKGNITDNGGEDCDKRGICWNTTGNPTVEDNKSEETDSFGTGAFSRPITGLSPGIKYYVKAYAHNSAGYGYGGEESFTTKPNAPSNLACVVQSSSQIDVDWIKGTGATRTMVRRKVGSYPSDVTDGDQAYYGNGTSFNDNPLAPATHYYYRAWSWVEGGDIWSDDYAEGNAWTPIGVPTVTTNAATGLAADLATLNGMLDSDGGEACDCGFEWGEAVPYGNTTPTQSRTTDQAFSQPITGLQPKTTYRFRAFATNSAGTGYGTIRTFTTPARLPITTTNPATGTSTLNGTLDDDGGEACDCGFEWGETDAYGKTTPTQGRRTGQSVLQTIGELLPDTTYHFRAFATNSRGTGCGEDRSFSTPAALPTVATNPATELGAIAAILNGTLDDDGGEVCECGFEWGLDTSYGYFTSTKSKATDQTFSEVIGGLESGTTYHFRAFATNSSGTGYGADMTFTTALVISRAFALAREEL